jgi:hypothetical protein
MDADRVTQFVQNNFLKKIDEGTLDLKNFTALEFFKQAVVVMDHFPSWRKRMYDFSLAKINNRDWITFDMNTLCQYFT